MSMVRRFVGCSLAVALVACCTLVAAQDAPKPGPEHERLAFWVGNWSSVSYVKDSTFMPAGKTTGSSTCDWFDGKFAVVCHEQTEGPMGKTTAIGIMSYSPEAKAYTYYGTDSSGMMTMTTVPKGTIEGKKWTYYDESMMEGEMVRTRYTIEETSEDSYTFTWEMQDPKGKWTMVMEGKGRRT